MSLFDTHAHLDDEQLRGSLDDVMHRAIQAGVSGIVTVGTAASSSQACIEIAHRFEIVHAAVGIHPNYCAEAASTEWDQIVDLTASDRVVALGETGLDRYWDHAPFALQQDYFDRHLRLSQRTGLPFIVHMRESLPDIMMMLREARGRGPLSGVMHSYTGDLDSAVECLDLGLFVSFAGMVTFKKSAELREVAAQIPGDRILIETDAPYLSPEPLRGQRPNEPSRVQHTAECLAQVRNVTVQQFARQTHDNACRIFARIAHRD
jgi:TatD DNase family protein